MNSDFTGGMEEDRDFASVALNPSGDDLTATNTSWTLLDQNGNSFSIDNILKLGLINASFQK